jgi:hypothetical protein
MIETLADEEAAEESAQIGVSRFLVKATGVDMFEISIEFSWKALAQISYTSFLLLRQDKFLLLLLVRSLDTLPWETAPEEVKEHVS